jgi:hypothetical protein
VKERLKQIDRLKRRIYELEQVIDRCKEGSNEKEIELSSMMIEEIMNYKKAED